MNSSSPSQCKPNVYITSGLQWEVVSLTLILFTSLSVRLFLVVFCIPRWTQRVKRPLWTESLYQSNEREKKLVFVRVCVCVSSSLRLQISHESQRIAPALWQMRKATVALAKVTGQMEAIPPEAGESSCDRGPLCHSTQDPMCACVFAVYWLYIRQFLSWRFLMRQCVCCWPMGNPISGRPPCTFTWGVRVCHVCFSDPVLFCPTLYGMHQCALVVMGRLMGFLHFNLCQCNGPSSHRVISS